MDKKLKHLAAALILAVIAACVLFLFSGTKSRWPVMVLPSLATAEVAVSTETFAREPAVINFWASWCVACREEHSVLHQMSSEDGIPVFGVNHLDKRDDALRWLRYFGDPYESSVYDAEGQVGSQLDIDVLPVSLVIDAQGVIHYRHPGPLDSATVETIMRPLIEDLRRK